VRRPFLRIEPVARYEMPPSAQAGLIDLQERVGPHAQLLVRALVSYAFGAQHIRTTNGRRMPPSVSALNRRRRAGLQWIQAILAGRVDTETLHQVAHSYLPQLAGSGPELHRGERVGLACIEYLRGAATALIFDAPAESLVSHAKALHALEAVLATHLAAYKRAVVQSRAAATEPV
jgi:hypothetical protein